MQDSAADVRRFRVHARHVEAHHACMVHEATFEAAAIAYVEDLHEIPAEAGEIRVIVRDTASGHEQCFVVDLASGETSSCE